MAFKYKDAADLHAQEPDKSTSISGDDVDCHLVLIHNEAKVRLK